MYPPPGIAREDWKIVRALGEFVGIELPYSNGDQMAERVHTLVPAQVDEVTPSTVRWLMLRFFPLQLLKAQAIFLHFFTI